MKYWKEDTGLWAESTVSSFMDILTILIKWENLSKFFICCWKEVLWIFSCNYLVFKNYSSVIGSKEHLPIFQRGTVSTSLSAKPQSSRQDAWLACAVLLWHQHGDIPEGMDWRPLIHPKLQQPLWSQFSFAQEYRQKEQSLLLPFLWPLVLYLSPATKLKCTLCMGCVLSSQHWSASRELLVLTLQNATKSSCSER